MTDPSGEPPALRDPDAGDAGAPDAPPQTRAEARRAIADADAGSSFQAHVRAARSEFCLLYTSDAADE